MSASLTSQRDLQDLTENPEDVILEALSEIRQAEIGLLELLASLRSGQNRDPQKPGGTIVVFTKK